MSGLLGNTALSWEDVLVIAFYFVIVLAVGIWSSVRSSRDSVSGYFLAGRSMHWIPVGASLFASNIGSGHFVGLAGSGANSGIAIAGFELNALFTVLILGWLFLPVYMAAGVYTMPEYLKKRFGGERIGIYLSVLALLLYVFTKISADLFAGAIFINQSVKIDLYLAVVVLLAISCIYTVTGGLTAVIWTDFVQTVLMVVGAFALMVLSFMEVGGYFSLVEKFKTAEPKEEFIRYSKDNESCSKVPGDYMHLFRPPTDSELPWTGMTLGLTVSAVWYWCTDQVIVQRALSSKSMTHAKAGCIMCGYLKVLPLYLIVLPGMAARVLYPNIVACSDPVKCKEACGSELGCTNIAYPLLVINLMPNGAKGLMLSVMLAALMSSLSSIFNSSSTIFTMDIWRRVRKQATEMELLIVGRLFVLLLVGISIAWIPVINVAQGSQLFHYIQSVTSYLAPPVCAVYVLAVTCARVNEKGAFWGLMAGLVIGLIRFGVEFSYKVPACAEGLPDPRPAVISKVHYLHFGIILFVIVCIVTLAISYMTEPIDEKHLHRLTFWTRKSEEERDDLDKWVAKQQKDAREKEQKGRENIAFEGEKDTMEMKETPFQENVKIDVKGDNTGTPKGRPKWWKSLLYFVCGMSEELRHSKQQVQVLSPEEEARRAVEFMSQSKLWKTVCDWNAIILLVVGSFIWGYYA